MIALINKIKFENLIIFFKLEEADKISRWLTEHGETVRVLHSDLKQRDRSKALDEFKNGEVKKYFCATDVASRGLDISNVTHVINYDVPQHSEDYVHRIGRIGRARTEGEAFTLCKPEELSLVDSIEKLLGNSCLENFWMNLAIEMIHLPWHHYHQRVSKKKK